MLEKLEIVFRETCLQMGAELLNFGAEGDHVHLMVGCPPKLAVANLVGKLKGKSSYIIRKEFMDQVKTKLLLCCILWWSATRNCEKIHS